jgi:hypothetical protein
VFISGPHSLSAVCYFEIAHTMVNPKIAAPEGKVINQAVKKAETGAIDRELAMLWVQRLRMRYLR